MLQESTQSGPGGGIQYEFVISLRCYIIEDSYNTNFICPCEQHEAYRVNNNKSITTN